MSTTLPSAYYAAEVANFLKATPENILGCMARASEFPVELSQNDAWAEQINILKHALGNIQGTILFEFIVPRIGSRIDAVILSGSAIIVIEFKIGEQEFTRSAVNQAWDYALDLKNFHKASHQAAIIPILVATSAPQSDTAFSPPAPDNVFPPARCNSQGLPGLIRVALQSTTGNAIDPNAWISSPYQPTPTIIEAARSLYARHSVDAISRHDAGANNLRITSSCVEKLIGEARKLRRKIIVFVTGVPGAGKTLVGLNVATRKRNPNDPNHAVFLSGNGPLIEVLSEALTRDEMARLCQRQDKTRKGVIKQKVKAFIQNVHHFRDAGLRDSSAPVDHVVIFDEAQRAWNQKMTTNFMVRRKKQLGFKQSEPEFLISYLNRHHDWAVVVCLVGGGQEINRGEAGISAWLDAIRHSFPEWRVYISPDLTDKEYAAGHALDDLSGRDNVVQDKRLHLAVSMRSFRAEKVSAFVKAVLDCERSQASKYLKEIETRYPIALTRNLEAAKQWVRTHARGSQRFGLVASSGAQRLKPHAVDVRVKIKPIHWFLNDQSDTRSSYYLEDAASEFDIQGLELDWVCVSWDADLRFTDLGWNFRSFKGSKWTSVRKTDRCGFLLNAYRVLLTRGRQGMVIFIPPGSPSDPTRSPEFYDPTFEYLKNIGVPVITR